jgi:peptidyl-prolyl cis-trans isomerase B (cyclophilin B)
MKKFFLIPLALVLTGCSFAPFGDEAKKDELVFCSAEVQTCPDGSTVARDPAQNCEFAACKASNSSTMKVTDATITLAEIQKIATGCEGEGYQTRCPVAGDLVAKFETTKGDVWVRLFPEDTPKTVENFAGLAERKYYDGLIFHRIIPDFMVQGGDPTGTGAGGASIWGRDFGDEFTKKLKNLRGALSMANRGPATNGSQFFIVQKEGGTPWLDGRHTVFGQTFAGLDIVDSMLEVERDSNDKPLTPIKMSTVRVLAVK